MISCSARSCALVTGAALLATGCGGGSAGGSSNPSESTLGPFTVMAIGAAKPPVVIGSRNAVVTGIVGAAFTSVKANMPPLNSVTADEALRQTSILVDKDGQPMEYEYGTGRLFPVGPEQFYGNSSTPSPSGLGDRVAVSQQSPDRTFQIFTMYRDGTGRVQITNASDWALLPAFSPNGKTVLFVRQDPANGNRNRIWSVSASGGTATAISPVADSATRPVWAPDGRIAFYRQINGTGAYVVSLMDANGANVVNMTGTYSSDSSYASLTFFPGTGSQEGLQTFVYGGNYYLWRFSTLSGGFSMGNSADAIGNVSAAPVGNLSVLVRGGTNAGIYIRNETNRTESLLLAGSGYNSPVWGPYVTVRGIIGVGSPLGASAGGFLFGQVGNWVAGILAVDATTRSTLTITPQSNPNPSQANAVCTVTADKVTSIKFINDLRDPATTVVSAGAPVSGAVISFNADTGRIASVVPYVGAVAPTKDRPGSYTAKFVGVWDGEGKNRAPNGASSISLDPVSGKILSVD